MSSNPLHLDLMVNRAHDGAAPDTTFYLGKNLKKDQVYLEMERVPNFNLMFIGNSGSGKTFSIRQMIANYWRAGVTVVIPDTQEDLGPGSGYEEVPDSAFNHVTFAYERGEAYFNPLQIEPINHRGFYAAIQRTVQAVKYRHKTIGIHQQVLLKQLLREIYRQFGIVQNDPSTWSRPSPTFVDLHELACSKMKMLTSATAPSSFTPLAKSQQKAHELMEKIDKENEAGNRKTAQTLERQLEALIVKASGEALMEVESFLRDREAKALYKTKAATLEGVVSILGEFVETGLYAGSRPFQVVPGKINVVNLKPLEQGDIQTIFFLMMGSVFTSAQRQCDTPNDGRLRTVFAFDEVKTFATVCNDPMSPLPRIVTEGRKSGMGTLIGCQSPKQVREEVRSAIGTVFLLASPPPIWDTLRQLYRVSGDDMQRLTPKKDCYIISSANSAELNQVDLWAY